MAIQQQLEALDREAANWLKATKEKLLFRLASLGLRDRVRLAKEVALRKSMSAKTRKRQGDIEALYFSFSKHGIFLEHGVGKGRPVRSAAADRAKKAWLSVVLPERIEELADVLTEQYADLAIEELKLNIPGVIQIKAAV